MHLIDAKCNNRIITSLFHFASTLATQNEIKKSKCNNYYIITKRAATLKPSLVILLYKPSVLFVGHNYANSDDPNQTPQNAASDQGLHCLLTKWYIKIRLS